MVRELDLDNVPELVRSLLDDPERLARMRGRCSPRRGPTPRTDRGRADRARVGMKGRQALVRRHRRRRADRVRAARPGARRGGRRLGSRPHAVPRAARRRADRDLTRAGRARRLGGVVSSAYPSVAGLSRTEFLRELVAGRRAIVVAGTHGKGTTAAMIAFVLRETGPRSRVADRRPGAAARLERRLRRGAARRRGRRVRPHGLLARAPRSPSSRTSSSTTTRSSRRRPSSRRRSRRGSPPRRTSSRRAALRRRAAAAGRAQPPERGQPRSRRSSSPASPREEAEPALARFTGTGRRFEVHERGGITVVDDYAHHPTEIAATIAAARERFPDGACSFSSSRTSTRARATSRPSSAPRSRRPTTSRSTDVYPAREQPIPGVTGKLIVDALSDRGVLAGWTPTVEQGAARSAAARGPATCCSCSARATSIAPSASCRSSVLVRGGERRARALHDDRHGRAGALLRAAGDARRAAGGALRFAAPSVACRGRDRARLEPPRPRRRRRGRSSCKLAGELAAARIEGTMLVGGGGRRTPSASTAPGRPSSAGFEFASAIPGTVGGGVRMNAGAYGGEWRDVLVDARVVDADTVRRLTPAELDLSYRHSGLGAGRGRRPGALPARAVDARGGEGDGGRAARAAQGDAADEQADLRQRLQEPRHRARGGAR